MMILSKVLHTSRELEIEDMEKNLAANYEKILGLKKGTVTVVLHEHPEKKSCSTNPVPHCHYAVTISYDETCVDKV